MSYTLDPYKNSQYGFPSEEVAPSVKEGLEWTKEWCEAIYSDW